MVSEQVNVSVEPTVGTLVVWMLTTPVTKEREEGQATEWREILFWKQLIKLLTNGRYSKRL